VLLLIAVAVGITCYSRAKKRRHAGGLDHYAHARYNEHVVPNPTYHVNTDDRARTGNVVVTNATDQIQYLIPMVEQAPGEYLVPVTRNQDYTYAPPFQPADNDAAINRTAGRTRSGGGGSNMKTGGGRNVDPNGYVVDESSAPDEPGAGAGAGAGAGKSGRNVDPDGYVVDGSDGPEGSGAMGRVGGVVGSKPIVYASYFEGSPGGITNTGVYGIPTGEYDEVVTDGHNIIIDVSTAVYGLDANGVKAHAANPKRARQLQLLAGAGAGAKTAAHAAVGDNGDAGRERENIPAPEPAVGGGRRTTTVRPAYANEAAVESFLADYEAPASAAGNGGARTNTLRTTVDVDGSVVESVHAASGVGGKTATLRRKYVNVIEGDEDSNA
jgi:hypothetical protein